MKQLKIIITVLFLISICISSISCQSKLPFLESETAAIEKIQFQETSDLIDPFHGMSEEDCFDVKDFTVNRFNKNGDFTDFTPVICFSYVPPESRLFDYGQAFAHSMEHFSVLSLDGFEIQEYLLDMTNLKLIRALRPNSTQKDAIAASFSEQFGVAYSISFAHNEKRSSEVLAFPEHQTHYDFLVSPLTKNNTYYLLDQSTLTVTEVGGEGLSFLEKAPEDWYEKDIFLHHIGFVEKIDVSIKYGTTEGVRGVKDLILKHRNTDENGNLLHPLDAVAAGPNAVLHVTAHYNGEANTISDIPKYRKFYAGLLWSSVQEIILDETIQDQLKTLTPDMRVKIHLRCDDQKEILEYRFFNDGSVLINGIYVGKLTDGHLYKLIRATGLMLSDSPADQINFW